MKITKVTMTGADDGVDPDQLIHISRRYPFVEWGILLSRNSQGKSRFPSSAWRNNLTMVDDANYTTTQHYSAHMCGAYVRELLMGNTPFIRAETGPVWDLFNRVQINTHGVEHKYDLDKLLHVLSKYSGRQFIFEMDGANDEMIHEVVFRAAARNAAVLFDKSHGEGALPDKWPLPLNNIKCGYAGGLSPENLWGELKKIEEKVGDRAIWIDMQTHIRDEFGQFDLARVKEVLQICEKSGYL